MLKNIKIVFLAFAAGIAGAWAFHQFSEKDLTNEPLEFRHESSKYNVDYRESPPSVPNNPVSFVEASEKSTPSVVFIKNFSGTDQRRYSIFDYFFGTGPAQRVSTGSGVIITHVVRNGGGEKAGLQRNDVITGIGNIDILGKGSFEEVLSYYYPGDKIQVSFQRNKMNNSAQVTLQNLEGGTGIIKREYFTSNLLGAQLEAVNTLEKDRLGIEFGVKITGMTRGYLRDLGLNNGFVITQVNGEPAKNPEEVGKYLEKFGGRLRLEGVTPNGQPFIQSYNVR